MNFYFEYVQVLQIHSTHMRSHCHDGMSVHHLREFMHDFARHKYFLVLKEHLRYDFAIYKTAFYKQLSTAF